MNNTAEEILSKLKGAKCVAVFCHCRPDGDAIGSGLALTRALENAGKKAVFCCEDPAPEKFGYIPAAGKILQELPKENFDTFVSVDCADTARMGVFAAAYSKFRGATVNIDHHISNNSYAKYNYVSECPATCEVLSELFLEAGFEITEEIANYLMLGLITDSGNFTHNDVTGKTFRIAARLKDAGADVNGINYNMFSRQPKCRAQLFGRVMNKLRFALSDKVAFAVITAADLAETGADRSVTEGFVDFPLTIDGVEVSVSVMEFKQGCYKASLRSKGRVNVNAVAATFGGGGHILASGCMIFGTLEETVEKITAAVSDNL